MPSIYLDYNATSPLSESVQNWLKSGDFVFANPMSQHSFGKSSRKTINEARSQVYSAFNFSEKDHRLLFHSGATEGFAMMAWSFSEWARMSGKNLLICFSGTDHPAVSSLAEKHLGSHVKFFELELNKDLTYHHEKNFSAIQDKKDNDPDLIILYHHLWVHNETGLVSALEDLRPLKLISDLYIHVDAVQTPGKIENWRELHTGDMFTFSAHKFGALKGVGFSFVRSSLPLYTLFSGGGQQSGLRGGTENPMGIQSVSLALADLLKVDVSMGREKKEQLEYFLRTELGNLGEVFSVNGKQNSNTIYFFLKNFTSDISLALFDLHGLMVSAGSACSSGAAKPSSVLLRSGHQDVARNGLRLSLGFQTTDAELELIKTSLQQIFHKLRLHSV